MQDALAVVGQWVGLVKAAKFAMAEISRDCEGQLNMCHRHLGESISTFMPYVRSLPKSEEPITVIPISSEA